MLRLPPELIDRIIDHLHDNPDGLRRCALVCKAWVAPSRFHLFYSISIDLRLHCLYPQSFNVIQHHTSVGPYVSELNLIAIQIAGAYDLKMLSPQILRSFSRLRKLKLEMLYWASLAPDISKAVLDILALPSLVDLEIVGTGFSTLEQFMNLFHAHLKRLVVDTPMWIDDEQDSEAAAAVPARQPCHLEHLVLSLRPASIAILDWLLHQSIIDTSNLRTLVLQIYLMGRQHDFVVNFVRNLPASLEHFTIQHFVDDLDCLSNGIDLGHLPSLLTLSIITANYENPAFYLISTLSKLKAPILQQIYFDLTVHSWTTCSDWIHLDRILDGHGSASLRSVMVSMKAFEVSTSELDTFHQKFIDSFPLLKSRGILDVHKEPVKYIFPGRLLGVLDALAQKTQADA